METLEWYTLNLSERGDALSLCIYSGYAEKIDSLIADLCCEMQRESLSGRKTYLRQEISRLTQLKLARHKEVLHPAYYRLELVWTKCNDYWGHYRIEESLNSETFTDLTWKFKLLDKIIRKVSQKIQGDNWVKDNGNHGYLHSREGILTLLDILPSLKLQAAKDFTVEDGMSYRVPSNELSSIAELQLSVGTVDLAETVHLSHDAVMFGI